MPVLGAAPRARARLSQLRLALDVRARRASGPSASAAAAAVAPPAGRGEVIDGITLHISLVILYRNTGVCDNIFTTGG